MNEHDEKEYNDIDSLAAYLHSGKAQEEASAGERAEMGLPPEPEGSVGGNELEGVLFSIGGRKRQMTDSALIDMDDTDPYSDDEDEPDKRAVSVKKTVDPSIPANPFSRASAGQPPVVRTSRSVKRTGRNTSIVEKAKNKFSSMVSDAKSRRDTRKDIPDDEDTDIDETAVKTVPERPVKKERPRTVTEAPAVTERRPSRNRQEIADTSVNTASSAPDGEIPALAASLSAALGEKAAEIVEQNRGALPPEDTPEIYDVEEGSYEEEEFDNTATRLMNAVNDPQERSVSMRDDVEAEEEDRRAERLMAARMRLNYERQKQSTRTLAYILIALLLCAAILGAAAYASTYIVKWALDFTGVASADFKIDVTIPDDANIETVAAILSENNIINDAKFFKMYADFADKLKGEEGKKDFIAGKYTVSSTMSYSTLLSMMRTKVNQQKTVDIRIVEGMTAHEIGQLLEDNFVCFAEDFEKYYRNIQNKYDFERRVKENPLKYNQLEGYLFPDTYQFYVVNSIENGGKPEKGQTVEEAYEIMKKESEENALEVAKKMYSNFNSKIT
ncbi:MAG: endolytic transglycosylase MltG, partial [Ruminiclostridium sp.]|nr:endolytic transglycosylase MltG [Ruminiclostridium sp.]